MTISSRHFKGRDRKEQDKREGYLYKKEEYAVSTFFIHSMNECGVRIMDDDDDDDMMMRGGEMGKNRNVYRILSSEKL
jgi:hypothetical protein